MFFTKLILIAAALAGVTLSSPLPRSSGSKKGLAYNDPNLVSHFSNRAISWGYNWGQDTSSHIAGGFEYVPMCWGRKFLSTWNANANAAIANGANHLLGFNEPDITEQANLSPIEAAALYKQYLNPFASRARLGAPAVSNSESPGLGLSWLSSWLSACAGGCHIDFVPIHWYDATGNVDYFKKCITKAHVLTGKPLWITEFGMPGATQEAQSAFLAVVTPWLDKQPFVERYSYFGVFDNILVQGQVLSKAGITYNS